MIDIINNVKKKQHYCQWQTTLFTLQKVYCHNNKSIDSLILPRKIQNMQRKKKIRTNAVILIVEMKIKKKCQKKRSSGFLLVNEKWAKEDRFLTPSWHFYMALRDAVY